MRPAWPEFRPNTSDENAEGSVSRPLSHEENQLEPPLEHRSPGSAESLANRCLAALGRSHRADKRVGGPYMPPPPKSSLPSQQRRQGVQEPYALVRSARVARLAQPPTP